jgi:hypothetical protein
MIGPLPQIEASVAEQPGSGLGVNGESLGMTGHSQDVGHQPCVGGPGVGVGVLVGRCRPDQAKRGSGPGVLVVRVEAVADDLLQQPVHDQGVFVGLHQPIAMGRRHRLVERERVVGQRRQLLGSGVELLGKELAGDLLWTQEGAHLQQRHRSWERLHPLDRDLPGGGHGVQGVAVAGATLGYGQAGMLAQPA